MTEQPNIFENSNIVYVTPVTIEHPKTSHKLSKTTMQAEKVSQAGSAKNCNSLYIAKQKKCQIFGNKNKETISCL